MTENLRKRRLYEDDDDEYGSSNTIGSRKRSHGTAYDHNQPFNVRSDHRTASNKLNSSTSTRPNSVFNRLSRSSVPRALDVQTSDIQITSSSQRGNCDGSTKKYAFESTNIRSISNPMNDKRSDSKNIVKESSYEVNRKYPKNIQQPSIVEPKRNISVFNRLSKDTTSHDRRPHLKCSSLDRDLSSNEPILYGYGDSFIGPLSLINQNIIQSKKFKGASAKGLNNPVSTLRVGETLIDVLHRRRPRNVLMVFGNVDFHMNFIFQLQTKGADALVADDFQKRIFDQYTKFLEKNILKLMKSEQESKCDGFIDKLLLSSVILPIVEDKYLELCIKKYSENEIQKHNPVTKHNLSVKQLLEKGNLCNLETRRCMVSNFNSSLKDWCSKYHNVAYVDINSYITESDSSAVRLEFRDKDPTNVHLLWESTIEFWLKEFNIHGIEVTPSHIIVDLQESASMYAIEKHQRMQRHSITSVLLDREEEK